MNETAITLEQKFSIVPFVRVGCAWVVGACLTLSGFGHVSNPYYFLARVIEYDLVPLSVGRLIAVTLPIIELGIAAGLILSKKKNALFMASAVLALVFMTVQSSAIWRGLQIDCGCFGAIVERQVGTQSIAIAFGLFLFSLLGRHFSRSNHGDSN